MTDARHDQAVALLTSSQDEVTLVVYREHLVGQPGQVPSETHQQELQDTQIVVETGPVLSEAAPVPPPTNVSTAKIDSLPARTAPPPQIKLESKTVTITTQSSVSQSGRTISQPGSSPAERGSYVEQFNSIGKHKPEPPPRTASSPRPPEVNHQDSIQSQSEESPYPPEVSPTS